MKKLLLRAARPHLSEPLAVALRAQYVVKEVGPDGDLLEMAREWPPDALIFDVQEDTQPTAADIDMFRKDFRFSRIPIVVLTDRHDLISQQELFQIGADHVIAKPVPILAIEFRLMALEQRLYGFRSSGPSVLEIGDIRVDHATHVLTTSIRAIRLTPIQFQILRFFALNADRLVRRAELIAAANSKRSMSPRTVDAHIAKLKKLVPELEPLLISSYGEGYILALQKRPA